MFQRQTHPDKRLIVLDDSGYEQTVSGSKEDGYYILRYKSRFSSLGKKRNACVRIAVDLFPEIQAVCPLDDDDLFFPHHLEITNAALENADWSLPSEVLYRTAENSFKRHLTGPGKFFHSAHGYRLRAFLQSGGYPDNLSGNEDAALFRRMEAINASICDPIALTGKPPSYCYGTGDGLQHISAYLATSDPEGRNAYAKIGEQSCEPAELVIEPPPGIDFENPVILPGVYPRPF